MEEPLKILVIEQRRNAAGGLAEFWEIATDVQALFRSACAFGPPVVLCSDDASPHAARSLLDSKEHWGNFEHGLHAPPPACGQANNVH
jgi:hypothetical protein